MFVWDGLTISDNPEEGYVFESAGPVVSSLAASPAQILAAYLAGVDSSAPFASWPGYVGAMPDGTGVPDNAFALYDTQGPENRRFLANGHLSQRFGVQGKIRALDYPSGYATLTSVSDTLGALSWDPVTVGGVPYTIDTVGQVSPLLSLGQDEKRRALFSVNFVVMLIGK